MCGKKWVSVTFDKNIVTERNQELCKDLLKIRLTVLHTHPEGVGREDRPEEVGVKRR